MKRPSITRLVLIGAVVGATLASVMSACAGPSLVGLVFACRTDADCTGGLACLADGAGKRVCAAPVATADADVDAKVALDAAEDAPKYGDGGCALQPANDREYLNQCSGATCEPFDNSARIQGFDPASPRPDLPPFDAGSGSGSSGSVADAGVDALPACSTLSPQPVIHVTGANAFKNVLGQLAIALLNAPNEADRRTLIFTAAGACQGVEALYEASRSVRDYYKVPAAEYWTAGGDPTTTSKCRIDDAVQYADLGLSGVFAASCNSAYALSSTAGDFPGPIQTTALVVPKTSSEHSISAEAAYHVYALGDAKVAPWTDRSYVYSRGRSATVQQILGKNIGVKPDYLLGIPLSRSEDMVAKVGNSPSPNATIGMLDSSFAENSINAAKIRMLAYRATGQSCGRFPNSTELAQDKANIRDGSYPLWSNMHFWPRPALTSRP